MLEEGLDIRAYWRTLNVSGGGGGGGGEGGGIGRWDGGAPYALCVVAV